MSSNVIKERAGWFGIAFLCLGYFLSYIPYTMLTKMLTSGLFIDMNGKGYTGFEIQPVVVLASCFGMFSFLTLSGWWKYATQFKIAGKSLPRPQWFTFLSGLCTASQIITTTLAYTFQGISIVFAMLLMRGGVLVMAPIVDLLVRKRKRRIYWPSWIAFGLSLIAILMTFSSKAGTAMTLICAIDISIYLFGYFFRLFIMSERAKSDDVVERKRYFTEEQLVANLVIFFGLIIVGFFGKGMDRSAMLGQIWFGITSFPFEGYFLIAFLIGIFSYGTGLFGSLIYLDKRENTFTVPANRASSVLAGVISTYMLSFFYKQRLPKTVELIGSALIIGAILFLMYRSVVEKRAARLSQAASSLSREKAAP